MPSDRPSGDVPLPLPFLLGLRRRRAGSAAARRWLSRSLDRSTTRSTKPCSNRNSARWKPSGSCSEMVPGRDSRSGEADQRARLGEVDVAKRGERGEHTACGGIGHDADERHARIGQPAQRGHRLGQLHERQRAFLHACPARGGDDDERQPLGQRVLGGARDLLAHDGAHRAAHEREVHDAHRDTGAGDGARAPHRRVANAGAHARRLEAVGVRLLVDEAEHVDRFRPASCSRKRVAVEQLGDARVDAQPEMVAAARADALVLVELLVVEHLLAVGAARPQVVWV